MKILIAGSNGMVGSAVTRHLMECGHQVIRVVRHTRPWRDLVGA
jgi:nucleoside-diphosphate-sugar epimerase